MSCNHQAAPSISATRIVDWKIAHIVFICGITVQINDILPHLSYQGTTGLSCFPTAFQGIFERTMTNKSTPLITKPQPSPLQTSLERGILHPSGELARDTVPIPRSSHCRASTSTPHVKPVSKLEGLPFPAPTSDGSISTNIRRN